MAKKKIKNYNPSHLIEAVKRWPNPMIDNKHGYNLYVEGKARSNQSRIEHIVEYSHDLKVRDLDLVPVTITLEEEDKIKGLLKYLLE